MQKSPHSLRDTCTFSMFALWAFTTSKTALEAPKIAQRPKDGPRGTKRAARPPKGAPRRPKKPRRRPGRLHEEAHK
eukprot:5834612-Pyramimonas_sp.AAC.1